MQLLAETYPHVTFSLTVRDLGATLDQELSLSQHVNLLTQLHQLRVVFRSLSLTMLQSFLFMPLLPAEWITVARYLLVSHLA